MTPEEIELLKLNPYEDYISPLEIRACVGDNSGVNEADRDCNIIDGYKRSVDILIQHIIPLETPADVLVYPLLFCCRHSVELYLKLLIKQFLTIYRRKYNIKTDDKTTETIKGSLKTHDISKLVECLLTFAKMDVTIEERFNEIKPVFDSLIDYAFDVDGDAFRYTNKKNWSDTNLKDIGLIDLGIFYNKYKVVSSCFDYLLYDFCAKLNDLYHGTFTKKLNRIQIEEISKKLPPVKDWKSNEFGCILNNIRNEYALSKNDLSEAISLIKKHYLFCNNIGLEQKLKTISESTFEKLRAFLAAHRNTDRVDITEPHFYEASELRNQFNFSESFFEDGISLIYDLPTDELCVLATFYEYSRAYYNGSYFCEDLDWLYEDTKQDLPSDKEHIFYGLCICIITGKLRQAFKDCGQLSYVALFDKYLAETVRLYDIAQSP